ncbi:MAG: luciferase [Chloroflexi bacterium]|nr:luciferase [Chloroflexota bacterium]
MAKLEIGVMDGLDVQELDEQPQSYADLFDDHINYAKEAEQLGYQYYFFIEHQNFVAPTITSPNVYLAALARETTTLRFGPMVYPLPFYHPIRLAQDSATLDHLSRGRLEFGIGYGIRANEFLPWKGVSHEDRRERGVEVMDIVLKAWTEDSVTYDGRFFSFEDALPRPKPFQRPHPRIWVGAHSEISMDYAAQHNFNVAQNIDTDAVAAEKFAYFKQAWEACGRAGPLPHRLIVRHVHVAETDEQARIEAEPYLLRGMRPDVLPALLAAGDNLPPRREPGHEGFNVIYTQTAKSIDYWVENGLALVGSPATVAGQLAERSERVGYDVFAAQHHIPAMPMDLVRKSLRMFGERVIPALA